MPSRTTGSISACSVLSLLSCFATLDGVTAQSAPTSRQTSESRDAIPRPKYGILRQNEDWSVLPKATPADGSDLFDPIKYVPLNDEGDVWLSFGGHARTRFEAFDEFAFGAAPNDNDTFLLGRIWLHADLHIRDTFRVFVEGKTAHSTERSLPGGRRAGDVDSLDLEQAFADLRYTFDSDFDVTLRVGRESLLFAKQRLVSPLIWLNSQQRWDGISALVHTGNWNTRLFATEFVPTDRFNFNEASGTRLFGFHAERRAKSQPKLDVYYYGYERTLLDGRPVVPAFNGTAGREVRHTVGFFLSGNRGPIDYEVESAYQFGTLGNNEISAWMVTAEGGYTARLGGLATRFDLGFDYATGDENAGGDVQTFNQLFPLGHAYLGYIDAIGRQNIINFRGGIGTKVRGAKIQITAHNFWRASSNDALYNVAGGVLRPAGSSRYVGSEIDLTLTYKFGTHLRSLWGYSHFFAGDFIDNSGPSRDIDFFYAQLQYDF